MTAPNSNSSILGVELSNDEYVNSLLFGAKWEDSNIGFSFSYLNEESSHIQDYSFFNEPAIDNHYALNFEQQQSVRNALSVWANVANINFCEIRETETNVGEIRVAFSGAMELIGWEKVIWGWSYQPNESPNSGDIWISSGVVGPWGNGSYNSTGIMHEIGHSLGLKHPFGEYGSMVILPTELDCQSNTIMSYNAAPMANGSRFSFAPTTPMVFDIDAVQYIYGANTTYNADDTVYSFGDELYHETIYDAGGIDTIKYTGDDDCLIDLRLGHSSNIGENVYINFTDGRIQEVNNIWIANNVVIENAMGGHGNDILVGNSQNNNLNGGEGIDTTIYNNDYVNFSVTKTENGFDIQGEGLDHITGVERIKFNNVNLALDLEGNAGSVAKIIGAVFGRSEIDNKELVGAGLNLIDNGMSISDIAQFALESKLGENYLIQNEICLLYFNIFDKMPSCSEFNYWEDKIDSGELDNISLAGVAITSELNKSNIGYNFLVSNGIEFV